jgi:hypothetical protein
VIQSLSEWLEMVRLRGPQPVQRVHLADRQLRIRRPGIGHQVDATAPRAFAVAFCCSGKGDVSSVWGPCDLDVDDAGRRAAR